MNREGGSIMTSISSTGTVLAITFPAVTFPHIRSIWPHDTPYWVLLPIAVIGRARRRAHGKDPCKVVRGNNARCRDVAVLGVLPDLASGYVLIT